MRLTCRKVDEVLVPELSSCLITLNNIESEMSFMHAHSIRTLTLISSDQKSLSSSSLQDAQRSKEVGSCLLGRTHSKCEQLIMPKNPTHPMLPHALPKTYTRARARSRKQEEAFALKAC